jgi:hypothetical protein
MTIYRRLLAWLTKPHAEPFPPLEEPPDFLLPASLEARRREIESELRRLNREADVLLRRLRRTK